MSAPAWALLLWSGAAAATAAGVLDALLGGRLPPGWMRRLATVVLWLVLLPALYGVVFELLGRSSLLVGGALGGLHAAVVTALRRRHPRWGPDDAPWRRGLVRVAFGLVLGFLYLVPGGA